MAFDPKGKSSKELYEAKGKIHDQAKAFLEANESNWAKEHEEQYSKMLSDIADISACITRRENLASLEATRKEQLGSELEKPRRNDPNAYTQKVIIRAGLNDKGEPIYRAVEAGDRGTADYQDAFGKFLRVGASGLAPSEMAALQSDSPTQAGYLLASEQFAAGILKDIDDILFIRRYARIHTVLEAGSLGIRKRTSRMNTFGWSQELTISTEDSALAYGKKVLTPHHLTGQIKLSRDLVRRSMNGAVAEVQAEMSRDAGEAMEDGYMTGSGANQPLGVFTASSDGISTGRDVNTGSATTILADSLHDMKYKLKSGYRDGARWLFHRDGIKIVSKLKDSQNQYLWQPGLQAGQPDRLLNLPLDESERAPNTFTNGLYVGLLANWRFYEIADALDMELQVLIERYADTNQIGYIGRLKTDGMPTLEEAFARLKCST